MKMHIYFIIILSFFIPAHAEEIERSSILEIQRLGFHFDHQCLPNFLASIRLEKW